MNVNRNRKLRIIEVAMLAILLLANSVMLADAKVTSIANTTDIASEISNAEKAADAEMANTKVVDTKVIDAEAAANVEAAKSGSVGTAISTSSCTTISSPGTYVLTADVIDSPADACFIITSSDVTLDGNGHTIDGTDRWTTFGVFVHNPDTALTNINIKNLRVLDWSYGIYYKAAINGVISNNFASSNYYGYFFDTYAGKNKLTGNEASSNQNGFHIKAGYNTLENNKANLNGYGFVIDQTSNNVLRNNNASKNSQGYYLYYTKLNTLNKNTANYDGNGYGFNVYGSNNNTLMDNNASQYYGFVIQSSAYNVLTGNNASSSNYGFYLGSSNNNTLKDSDASAKNYGIYLYSSGYNNIRRNRAIQNSQYGIRLDYSNNNLIYDNIFNNTNNYYLYSSANIWNVPKKPSVINVVNGLYTAGNVWENPIKTGFSQICSDADRNGLCDSAYPLDGSNIDNLPLVHHDDKTVPRSVANLHNTSYTYNYIKWTWNDPSDIDFSYVKIYIDGKFKYGVLNGVQLYNATGFLPNTNHTIGTKTVDINGNENATLKTHTAKTKPDSTRPESITNLKNITYKRTYINWTWKDPATYDFSEVMVHINGKWKTNVPKGKQFYNATGLTNNTSYKISTHTRDTSGNINSTWVNHTAKTAP